jgi:hypothetical protein
MFLHTEQTFCHAPQHYAELRRRQLNSTVGKFNGCKIEKIKNESKHVAPVYISASSQKKNSDGVKHNVYLPEFEEKPCIYVPTIISDTSEIDHVKTVKKKVQKKRNKHVM